MKDSTWAGGSYLSVTTRTGDDYAVKHAHQEQLEAELEAYINTPKESQKDKVLSLELIGGNTWRVPISAILCFADNTEDSRSKNWELNRAIDSHRLSLFPDWDRNE